MSSIVGMPIAEDLVRCGVPVAVAMAGSVADQACRLFTRRFGAVLASGGSLLQAAADARLAAYRRNQGPPSATIDWALPSVFLSAGVRYDYHPVAKTEGVSVSRQIEKFDFAEGPVFCGRGKFSGWYDKLMAPGLPNVLAIYSLKDTRGLGKSRLLREYGTRALLDGHVPCVVGLDGQNRPGNARRFAEAMLWSMNAVAAPVPPRSAGRRPGAARRAPSPGRAAACARDDVARLEKKGERSAGPVPRGRPAAGP